MLKVVKKVLFEIGIFFSLMCVTGVLTLFYRLIDMLHIRPITNYPDLIAANIMAVAYGLVTGGTIGFLSLLKYRYDKRVADFVLYVTGSLLVFGLMLGFGKELYNFPYRINLISGTQLTAFGIAYMMNILYATKYLEFPERIASFLD